MSDPTTMPSPAAGSADAKTAGGEIYDLGYQNYDGIRLGRRAAVVALAVLSLRNAYGIGRGTFPKVLAFGLGAIALLPAAIVLITVALVGGDTEVVEYAEFFGFVQIVILLFVATMASELVGNDRKNNTLTLYFSRPIERSDYVFAKVGALTLALLPLTLLPQILIFIGRWMSASDSWDWLRSDFDELGPVIASSLLASLQLGAVGLAIAMFTRSRAYALVAVLGGMIVTTTVVSIIVELAESTWSAIAIFMSPLTTMSAMTTVLFDGDGGSENFAAVLQDIPDLLWVAGPLIHAAIALGLTLRRYQKAEL